MRALALVAVLALALGASTAGCLGCQDQLDVHHCLPDRPRCDVAALPTFTWDAANLTALWPDLDRLLREVGPGLHGHADWTRNQADAFWTFYGIPVDQPDKQLLLRHDGALYHVRIQAC